jgi:hypothetical protein
MCWRRLYSSHGQQKKFPWLSLFVAAVVATAGLLLFNAPVRFDAETNEHGTIEGKQAITTIPHPPLKLLSWIEIASHAKRASADDDGCQGENPTNLSATVGI